MKAIRLRLVHVDNKEAVVKLLYNYLVRNGFAISNPDNLNGRHLDIFVRGEQRVAGFGLFTGRDIDYDLFWEGKLNLILDWIEDHGRTVPKTKTNSEPAVSRDELLDVQ